MGKEISGKSKKTRVKQASMLKTQRSPLQIIPPLPDNMTLILIQLYIWSGSLSTTDTTKAAAAANNESNTPQNHFFGNTNHPNDTPQCH